MNTSSFFDYLNRRADSDTAVVAALRRSLSSDPGTDTRVFPLVEPWLGQLSDGRRATVYLAAGLWASAARRTGGKPIPLAQALRRINNNPSAELRFIRLLDADLDELQWRLRQGVALLSSTGIAIDWPQLLDDLLRWNSPSRSVQSQWARQFWATAAEPGAEPAAESAVATG